MSTDTLIPNIDRYLAYCKHLKVNAKGTIFQPADAAESIFYIVEGTVVIMMEDRNGREMIIGYSSAGNFLGELGVYTTGLSYRDCRVVAKTDCKLGELPYDRFLELVRIYPSIMQGLDAQIVRQLKETTHRVLDLASLDTPDRVTRCLLDLCKLPQAKQLENGVQIKVSRQEISQIVGCTRESVGRIIQKMNETGEVQSKGMTMLVYGAVK